MRTADHRLKDYSGNWPSIGHAKIARFDTGATLLDVNSSQQYSNDSYREPSFIIRIGMDKCDGKWCERYCFDGGDSRFHEIRLVEDVISAHNKVVKDHGRVAFGRFGELNHHWWNLLHGLLNSSDKRIGAKLIIVLRRGTKYQGFSTRAFKLGESCEDPCLIPEYYRYLFFEMNVWFEIGELTPMHSNELAKYTEDIVYAVKRRRSISKTL
ncbi:MAG TPA: hypothetical protein EYN71_06310, partial [Flavobacteriales bacterium]|nr:hypothetical protein [Flavobacteriales bacterium]